MAEHIIMPKQGNTVEQVILLEWKKREGDPVEEGETLCEVETDKATFEVPSTAAGTLLRQLYREGDDVPVMEAFAVVGEAGEEPEELPAESSGRLSQGEEPGRNEQAGEQTAEKVESETQGTERRSDAGVQAAANLSSLTGRRSVRISPLARRTAERLGISESDFA
ncbi:MAG: biotin/lipoyl-containing protein, partial [Spirochaetaceae bacterium]